MGFFFHPTTLPMAVSGGRERYINECLARGEVPIKPEYLPQRRACAQESQGPSQQGTVSEAEGILTENGVKPSRQRGQNKKRRLNTQAAKVEKAKNLCHNFASGGSCPAWEAGKCLREHDLKSRREAILQSGGYVSAVSNLFGPACVWGEICPSGINCCIDPLGHTDAEGHNIDSTGKRVSFSDIIETKKRRYRNFPNHIVAHIKAKGLHKRTGFKRCEESFNALLLDDEPVHDTNADETEIMKNETEPAENEIAHVQQATSNETPHAADGLNPESELLENKENQLLAGNRNLKCQHLSVEEKRDQYRKLVKGKAILAPLTTVGNLPFRRLCVSLGCEVTMSEMILASSVCTMKACELALFKRHESEKVFGVQLAGGYVDQLERAATVIDGAVDCDFVDINAGCPLEGLHKRGAGCALLAKEGRVKDIVSSMTAALTQLPLTFKTRTAFVHKSEPMVHELIPKLIDSGISGITVHARTAKQRYLREADWKYLQRLSSVVDKKVTLVGNGDLFGDPNEIVKLWEETQVDSVMIGRGALIKPWIFEEIRSGQLLDPSSTQRLEYLKRFCHFGLDHWGCDAKGVETTRRFLLEQLSFLHRYVPVGLLEVLPQKLNCRPPAYQGRDELETLMGKPDVTSWIRISEMLLGKPPEDFAFIPKHKSTAYDFRSDG
eukprot:Gregarina_sp_Poly_1__89@NODE_101_length_14427_cov_132_160237_g88_i0_p2_GENE_NODE_101_length_14427_cov_132_160237_g88_i0NODE_101_length_14427_cov_132_160237_g88_i0_p2_ORF_typecomplete_len668_score106_86Dus/PF01207_17/1_8e71Oxidored_FMN/PF00724_20/0_013_NODE_101_length_14427_cov_132_160237_g88_i01012012123